MVKLRKYQQTVVDKIYAAWLLFCSILAVVPTGGGKTVIFSYVLSRHDGAGAVVVHRKEILAQISCALGRLGVTHRVIAPPQTIAMIRKKHMRLFKKAFIDPHALIGVVSAQTLASRGASKDKSLVRWSAQVTLAVYDEGHHYVKTGAWAKAVEAFPNARRLFVTATPARADGKGLGVDSEGYCETLIEGPQTQWLIDQGHLSRFKYKAPMSDINLDDLPVTASGEVSSKAMRARTVESHLVGDVVQKWLDDPDTRGRKTIVFAADVETAVELAERFRAAGVNAEELNGGTDSGVRERALEQFEFGDLTVLVNVDLFDEGFDVPGVEVVVMARVTMSLSKYLQMVGRALRVAEGKEFAVIVDPVRNWERHGAPTWPRKWSLEGNGGGRNGASDLIPQRVCRECTQPYEAFFLCCPYCGAEKPEPAGRATPEQVDGDLFEMDLDAWNVLYARYVEANKSVDEYAEELIGRNVPEIARPRLIRKHDALLYRRGVLQELVAWWLGMQPRDREDKEKQSRFFLRFGVDIMQAFALDEKETDNLIARIGQKFSEDLTP